MPSRAALTSFAARTAASPVKSSDGRRCVAPFGALEDPARDRRSFRAEAGDLFDKLGLDGAHALTDAGGGECRCILPPSTSIGSGRRPARLPEAAVFHCAGDARFGVALENRRTASSVSTSAVVSSETVRWQHLTRTDGVFYSETQTASFRRLRDWLRLHSVAKQLCVTPNRETRRRRVVGVVGVALDVHVLIIVGTGRVGTGALEHRPAERGVCAAVAMMRARMAVSLPVSSQAGGEVHLHRVALGWMSRLSVRVKRTLTGRWSR